MTKFFTPILILLFVINVTSQSTIVNLDYTVSYEIPSVKKGKDTLSISFDKDGKFLFTDTNILAKDLARKVFRTNQALINNSKINLLFDVEKELAYINFNSGQNHMFLQMDINSFLPSKPVKQDSIESKEVQLISKQTDEKVWVMNSEYKLYEIYTSGEVEQPVYVAFDESNSFNINNLLYLFFEKLALTESTLLKPKSISKGIIMQIKNHKGDVILTAVNILKQHKKIEFNHSFTID